MSYIKLKTWCRNCNGVNHKAHYFKGNVNNRSICGVQAKKTLDWVKIDFENFPNFKLCEICIDGLSSGDKNG